MIDERTLSHMCFNAHHRMMTIAFDTEAALRGFADNLVRLIDSGREITFLSDTENLSFRCTTNDCLTCGEKSITMQKHDAGLSCVWVNSREGWREVTELLQAMCAQHGACHQYFSRSASDDAEIQVAMHSP